MPSSVLLRFLPILSHYQLKVTSVPYAAELVCLMYAGRADSENRTKEFNQDLSLDIICLNHLMARMWPFGWAALPILFWPGFVKRSVE